MATIEDRFMGDIWPAASPGADGADYGKVTISPQGRFQIRSMQSFQLTYTVGEYGLDDTGAIKIVSRWTSDSGPFQSDDPTALNYVTACSSTGVRLAVHCEPYPHQRPWYNGIRVQVEGGYLSPGDAITVTIGDQSAGSPGYRLQTFVEKAFEFRVLADVCATGAFLPVGSAMLEIAPGPPERWVLAAPTLRAPGEAFSLGIRGEDKWGNASDMCDATFGLQADGPVDGLPERVTLTPGPRGFRIEGLSIYEDGVTRFQLLGRDGEVLALSNPVVTRQTGLSAFWGDLHGQSGETVGIDTIDDYMRFARDVAFLDVTSHQANDFQLTDAFWQQINDTSAAFNEDGRFVMFPGYEWSANTPLGGDHNVFFRHEGRPIHRSSHALLEHRGDIGSDAQTLSDLFTALQGEDAVLYAHIGGRPADISKAEDPRLRTAVEVHSDWGSFEWIMTDAFDLGYRVGLVCNSDGHKGAPGACYPGASEFGAYSGLTCFLAKDLSRDGIFESLRKRHHYGTTGARMFLDVRARMPEGSALFETDPRLGDAAPLPATQAMMGDIVQVAGAALTLSVEVAAHAPIERVDVLSGAQVLATHRAYSADDLGERIRVIWQGAEYRGRGRQTRWLGELRVSGPEIARFGKINAWNHERPFFQKNAQTICFDAITTGNFGGCDLWLDGPGGALEVATGLVQGAFDLSQIGLEDRVLDAGGLDRKLRLFRLPDTLTETSMRITQTVPIAEAGDTPIWVRVVTEDGFVGWSSPIYAFRQSTQICPR